jgi:hypothetical protein
VIGIVVIGNRHRSDRSDQHMKTSQSLNALARRFPLGIAAGLVFATSLLTRCESTPMRKH